MTQQIEELSLTGEVVEIVNHESKPVTTVYLKPFTIKLDDVTDVRLGDGVVIDVSIMIHSINFQSTIRRNT